MNFKELGRTGLKVSELGIGTEHLFDQTKDVVKSVILSAIEKNVNYFDVLFSVQHYLEKLALPFKGYRDQLIITGHLGTTEFQGKARRNRNIKENRKAFLRILSVLKIDYVDILNIQYVKANEFEKVMNPKGLLDLAISFRDEGKARYLGLSTHDTAVAKQAIKIGKIDMIMFPINLANHGLMGRDEFLTVCSKNKIGLVAIKPFAGGKLLKRNQIAHFAKCQTGGLSFKKKIPPDLTPSKCINYVKSFPEVSVVLMGVKNVKELNENLGYFTMKESELDYSQFIKNFQ
ncbi:MAG: aldo/keto reductase [Candidatus Hermodarchaeota archaeon]